MSHLFEIESAVFIKPYIFILASEAERGLSRLSGVLSPAHSHCQERCRSRLAHTPLPPRCDPTPMPRSQGWTQLGGNPRKKRCIGKTPTPKLTSKSGAHSPAPTSQLVSSSEAATGGDLLVTWPLSRDHRRHAPELDDYLISALARD